MKGNPSLLIQLPTTEEELKSEIQDQNERGITPEAPGEILKFVLTRLARVEVEIEHRLEHGEITEEEADDLRQKYVLNYINSLPGEWNLV